MRVGDAFAETLASARDGDDSAFVVLFRSVQPALLRYLGTLSPHLAEDAAGETWERVVRGLGRFRGDERDFRAWVFTIGHARLVDAQRAAARRPVVADGADALLSLPAAVNVGAQVEELFTTEEALSLLGRLPPDQAAVVLLRHVAGLDVGRTAAVLGKSTAAVRVAAHRGLRGLAAILRDPPAGPGVTLESEEAVT